MTKLRLQRQRERLTFDCMTQSDCTDIKNSYFGAELSDPSGSALC